MAKDNNYPANSELGAEHHLNIVKIAIPHIVQLFKSLFKLVLHFLVGGAQIIIGGAQFNFGGARAPPKRYKSTPLEPSIHPGTLLGANALNHSLAKVGKRWQWRRN